MRKFGLVISLAAAAIAAAACNNTGMDGSWNGYNAGQGSGSEWGGSKNANGGAQLVELTVAVSGDGIQTWWSPESKGSWHGCLPGRILTLYKQMPANIGTFGRFFDTGESSSFPMGDIYSTTEDENGDNWVNGPTIDQINNIAGGYSSALAFYAYCDNGAPADVPWQDAISVRQITPLNGYYSTALTDNVSAFMQPAYNNDASQHESELTLSAMKRLPLATRIEILKTIDVNEDVVRTQLPSGYVIEEIKARLTSMTIDGETFVPSQETSVILRDFAAMKVNLQDVGFKSLAGWLADRLEVAVQEGREINGSVTINDSLTVSTQELHSLFPNTVYAWAGQGAVDRLRMFAGTFDGSGTRRFRLDRRFDEDIHADVNIGVSK